jgi:hypothetical protein
MKLKRGKPKFLGLVRITLRTNHYSPKTEEGYLAWIKQFIIYNNKTHPKKLIPQLEEHIDKVLGEPFYHKLL